MAKVYRVNEPLYVHDRHYRAGETIALDDFAPGEIVPAGLEEVEVLDSAPGMQRVEVPGDATRQPLVVVQRTNQGRPMGSAGQPSDPVVVGAPGSDPDVGVGDIMAEGHFKSVADGPDPIPSPASIPRDMRAGQPAAPDPNAAPGTAGGPPLMTPTSTRPMPVARSAFGTTKPHFGAPSPPDPLLHKEPPPPAFTPPPPPD